MGWRGIKRSNDYAAVIHDIDAPKTVWMAIAFSLALRLNDDKYGAAQAMLREEWRVLHENGIVPQRPR